MLEELKSAAAAAQARVVVAFGDSQEDQQRAAGLPEREIGKGVAAQVALAKRESPGRSRRYLGWSRVLTSELPCTYSALSRGLITEWRAHIVARETIWLTAEDRRAVDADIADRLEEWGDRRVEAEVKKAAYRRDREGFVRRSAGAAKDRTVTVRPAPDTMSYLTGYLPVAQGAAVYAALRACADSLKAQGDERSRAQIMADLLVQRVTGQAEAEAVPVEISLVMTDQALFNHGPSAQEPAHLTDFGPIPAELARRLLLAADAQAQVWLRRLYTAPDTGQLASIDARRRLFDGPLRTLLVARDQWCRTPWCGAPIRHADHVVPVAQGGATDLGNGQGLCEACNQAKESPRWSAQPTPDASQSITTITPTGHRYHSRAPDPPGRPPPCPAPPTRLELYFADVLIEAA